MKTRRILAASTAALLAFGTSAVVASATDVKPADPTVYSDFDDMEIDEWNELTAGVSVKVTEKAAKANEKYSLGATDGAVTNVNALFEMETPGATVSGKASTVVEKLDKTTINKIKKVLKAQNNTTSSDVLDKGTKAAQVFEIAVGYNEDAEEVPVDSIKLSADVTVRLTTTIEKGKVYHVSSDGKSLEAVKTTNTKNAGGTEFYYTFTTNQFSPYIILEDVSFSGLSSVGTASTTSDTSAADPANSDGATSTNPDTGIALAIAPVVLAAGAVAVVALKKKH